MSNLKFLILLPYYNRPNIVKKTILSIKNSKYNNWEWSFIDDNSEINGENIVRNIFDNDEIKKVKFYNTNDTLDNKILRGSVFGKFMNDAIYESDADIGIFLCDDDLLHPEYLNNLKNFYINNTNIQYAYSYLDFYSPIDNDPDFDNYYNQRNFLNNISGPINPCRNIDASQITWRLSCNKEDNIWFPYPQTRDLDLSLLEQLYTKYGNCYPTNFIGQIKGVYYDQLCNRPYDFYTIKEQ